MTIIVFLVDTSASMHQRAYLCGRSSLLDAAKNAVETFIKVRQRTQESRGDRYMLLSFEEPPNNVKSGFKENLNTFKNELKNLQCLELSTVGNALKNTFDVLNLNRMQTGIDTYGQGRCPFYLEPSVIVLITDGGKFSSATGVLNDFNLPMHNAIPGSELTREPFRWDQRLYALVLRLSATPTIEREIGLVPSDNSPITAMCEVTGGRSYMITSHSMMMQSIESLVQKVQSGVVINFEKFGPDPESRKQMIKNNINEEYIIDDNIEKLNDVPMNWHSCRKMIFVPRSAQKGFAVGFWPLPESFWPDVNISILPPRHAHPNVRFTCTDQEPMIIENLPFDKYELEPSPLTHYILARKQSITCWQVFIANSYKNSELCHPFGYLKANTNLTCVNLFVMPYNYPVLLPLLDELFKELRLKPTPEWSQKFRNYVELMPSYYVGSLRRALTRMGVSSALIASLIPDSYEMTLSISVLNYLKKVKNQAKIEFDRLCNDVFNRQNNQSKNPLSINSTLCVRVFADKPLKVEVTHPHYHSKAILMNEQLKEYGGYAIGISAIESNINTKSYRNPFDTHRADLLQQVIRMRTNFLQSLNRIKLFDDDAIHSLPISEMGNYQEYLKRMPMALREIESTPVRRHMFGNPFKIDKRMMVDEADIDLVGGATGGSSTNSYKSGKRNISETGIKQLPMKRKPGPIPKNYKFEPTSLSYTQMRRFEVGCTSKSEKTNTKIPEEGDVLSILEKSVTQVFDTQMEVDTELHNSNNNQRSLVKTTNQISYRNIESTRHSLSEYQAGSSHKFLDNMNAINITSQIQNPIDEVRNLITKNLNINEDTENMDPSTECYKTTIMHHNLKIKRMLFTDVRKPGKDYQQLMDRLKLLKGEFHAKEIIIKQVYCESLRFKRAKLAQEIMHYLQILESQKI